MGVTSTHGRQNSKWLALERKHHSHTGWVVVVVVAVVAAAAAVVVVVKVVAAAAAVMVVVAGAAAVVVANQSAINQPLYLDDRAVIPLTITGRRSRS
jgi:hypothetical protein